MDEHVLVPRLTWESGINLNPRWPPVTWSANKVVSPFSSSLGTFRQEERLQLSDRIPILMTSRWAFGNPFLLLKDQVSGWFNFSFPDKISTVKSSPKLGFELTRKV